MAGMAGYIPRREPNSVLTASQNVKCSSVSVSLAILDTGMGARRKLYQGVVKFSECVMMVCVEDRFTRK